MLGIVGTLTIRMKRRRLYIPVLHIDTNLINARQKLDSVNQLERWLADEVILINMSSTAHAEAQADGNELRIQKANQQIFTAIAAATEGDPHFRHVETTLFPNGAKNENQRNDIKIVCEALKYQAILVTGDRGILGNSEKLSNLVQILSPDEAVAYIRYKICERDEFNKRVAKEFNCELPPWAGKD
ncbi:MAG: hypothetical protein ACYDCJ_04280 [Gammaproteobacteria bacterium]